MSEEIHPDQMIKYLEDCYRELLDKLKKINEKARELKIDLNVSIMTNISDYELKIWEGMAKEIEGLSDVS